MVLLLHGPLAITAAEAVLGVDAQVDPFQKVQLLGLLVGKRATNMLAPKNPPCP